MMTEHELKLNGCKAQLTDHLALREMVTQRLADLEERLATLELLVSEEIMAGLAQPAELREIVEELGAGWRIERQPVSPNASAATSDPLAENPAATIILGDTWLPGDWVTQYTDAVDGQ
jgi:hypothetical protein